MEDDRNRRMSLEKSSMPPKLQKGLVSKQMKQLMEPTRSPESFSQKNCAQQYTSLVESLKNTHKLRKRAADGIHSPTFSSNANSEEEPVVNQLINKLSNDRLEELRMIIHKEKVTYKKLRREIESIKNGEYDSQLSTHLEQGQESDADQQNRSIDPQKADDSANSSDSSVPKSSLSPSAQVSWLISPTTPLSIGEANLISSPSCSPARLICTQLSPTKSIIRSPPITANKGLITFEEKITSPERPKTLTDDKPVSPTKALTLSIRSPLKITTIDDKDNKGATSDVQFQSSSNSVFEKVVASKKLSSPMKPDSATPSSVSPTNIPIIRRRSKEIKQEHVPRPVAPLEPGISNAVSLARSFSQSPTTVQTTFGSTPAAHLSTPAARSSPHAVPPAFMDFDSYRAWKRTVLNVFNVVAGHKHANLFYKPVSDEQAPFYSKLILKPTCLNELKKNLETQQVTSTEVFKRDLMLVFANAVMYNPRQHEVHCMAVSMAEDTVPRMNELLESLTAAPKTHQQMIQHATRHATSCASSVSVDSPASSTVHSPQPADPASLTTRSLRNCRSIVTAMPKPIDRPFLRKRESSETSSLDGQGPPAKRKFCNLIL